ncbi:MULTISPECIES: hypothetical protein [unclassified Lysobacter]|uniref:hypothetical protein n=1 Tax=unclassified Lysobacter TaxID=2635362 RepID=UPI001C230FFF|nr:hypothetical protein [Lysobacter sp. MMG2]MBU8976211.1 hypothetical protein [Lysobacter sp. MMG2]
MNRFDDEPLSPEERALADRLARLGPHDGPSAALDAKILAAAHAAVAPAPSRRRRWLGLAALPGGLITGAGMAAALVLVVGVVWQLRPSDPAPRPARSEGVAYVSAEIIQRKQPVVAPPPPAEAAVARALEPAPIQRRVASARSEAAPAIASAPPPMPAAAPAPKIMATVGPDEQSHYLDEAIMQAPAPAAYSSAPAAAAPAAPAPPAALSSEAAADAARREAFGLKRARQEEAYSETTAAAESRAAAKASAESATLDRIEVSGSRVKNDASLISAVVLADIPLDEDARLEAKAWLERIRERRATGDIDGARASLARFRQVHPDVRVPRDLRALAQPPATR